MRTRFFIFLIFLSFGFLFQPRPIDAQSVSGTYRCFMFNVSGAGKRCTSPALVLHSDGKYTMGSEKGTYTVKGENLMLSESKIRGAGKFQQNNHQIVFEYTYKNWRHRVTYAKQDIVSEEPSSKSAVPSTVNIDVTVIFPGGGVGWINGAAIIEKGKMKGPETLANNDGKKMVTTYFRNMPTGKVYDIYVTTGFEKKHVGTVDTR